MKRREYLAALSAAVAARRESGGSECEPEEWEPIGTKIFRVGEVATSGAHFYGDSIVAGWNISNDQLDERRAIVEYDRDEVLLNVKGKRGGDRMSFGSGVALSVDEARDLAVALFQAAEEKEKRPDDSEETDG
jgi:hypothetical protein